MSILVSSISVGDVLRAKCSKRDGRLIAYSNTGKIVLFKNREMLRSGFVSVDKVLCEKENYILVTAQNIAYDYYAGSDGVIPYTELCEVLTNLGFVREYLTTIDSDNVFDVWADLLTGNLITIETWNRDGAVGYNHIYVYVPTGDTTAFTASTASGFAQGSYSVCCFDVQFCKVPHPIRYILSKSSGTCNWNGETPDMWHYGDTRPIDHAKVLERLYACADNINELFNMRVEDSIVALTAQ